MNEPSETFQVVLQYSGGSDDINVGSPANGTITNTETLEASFENMPASHDGSNFSFNLAFTAEVGISVQHMRDWAFTMVNGTMTSAQRVDGRYDYWKLTVDPEGNNNVTITVKGGPQVRVRRVHLHQGRAPREADQQPVGDDRLLGRGHDRGRRRRASASPAEAARRATTTRSTSP